MNDLGKQKGM